MVILEEITTVMGICFLVMLLALVDPFTGEGIGNALESGKIAADVIFSSKANNDFSKKYLSIYDRNLWGYLGSELDTSTKLLKLANHKILLNFVIDRASRNDKVRNVISGMLANEVPRQNYLTLCFT